MLRRQKFAMVEVRNSIKVFYNFVRQSHCSLQVTKSGWFQTLKKTSLQETIGHRAEKKPPVRPLLKSVLRLNYYSQNGSHIPGGGLDIPNGRDQQSGVSLNDSPKYFSTEQKPKEYFLKM